MFDNSLTQLHLASWHDTLGYGDIVHFRFPIEADDGGKCTTPRPCLVLDTESFAGTVYAILAPSIAAKPGSRSDRGYQISVRDPELLAIAELDQPTQFEADRRICVPVGHDGFEPVIATGSPVLGRLTGPAFDRMNSVRARVHAERDMARERQSERRRSRRQNGRRLPRPVIIERRRRKRLIQPIGSVA